MSRREIILYSHSGSQNHGCEALVRSTAKLLKDNYNINIMSSDIEGDKKYNIHRVCGTIYSTKKYTKKSIEYIKYAIKYRINKKRASVYPACCNQIKPIIKAAIAFSIGGDNYCYLDESMEWLIEELISSHKYFYNKGVKTVLWGCSIEEETLKNKRILKDLKKFDLITVRETMSAENLYNYGIKDNVVMTCDSAFHLDTVNLPLPENFIEGNTVGINISPMVIEKEKIKGIVLKNYFNLIDYIINKTDMNVALIPHVIWAGSDDRETINIIYDEYGNSNRVVRIDDCNCEELKGYIARCRFFVGARTHSTIAAYSASVPTLVSGYSIKSKGIAKDLFGTYDNYVVPVSEMTKEDDLLKAFKWLEKNEKIVKNTLINVMPEYKQKINEAIEAVNSL